MRRGRSHHRVGRSTVHSTVAATFRSPSGACAGGAPWARHGELKLAATKTTYALMVVVLLVSAERALGQTPAATPPSPVQVTTRVEPLHVTIGTPFRYTMSVRAPADVELVVPVLAEKIGDFTIRDFGELPRKQEGGSAVIERWYDLVTYEPGDKIVPGPPVHYRVAGSDLERVDAPDAVIVVDSLLSKEKSAPTDVRDVKPPVAVPRDYTPLLWLAGGIALLAAIGAGLYRFLNRSRAVVKPPRPADEIALEALARLRSERLLEKEEFGEFYVRLSAVVRAYLEARFELRAPEMTTEEFLQVAQRSPQLNPAQRSALGHFLSEADLVKFARYRPSPDDAERAFAAAGQFVESTAARAGGVRAAA